MKDAKTSVTATQIADFMYLALARMFKELGAKESVEELASDRPRLIRSLRILGRTMRRR